jgi:beta-phosphoglucomutase
MLGGVIFDFDGVIVNSHPLHIAAWKALLLSKSKHVNDADLSFVSEGAKRAEILRHFLGELTPEQIASYGAEKDKLFRARARELQLISGFADFLDQLNSAGLPCAVATSGSRSRVEHTLAAFNLRNRFRAVVTGDEVERGKPDPALFLLTAQALQIDPSRILVFEDAIAGVLAAKSSGMKCVGIAGNGRESLLKQAGADRVMNDFAGISFDDLSRLFV